jgi:hypothetical protein
MMRLAVPVLLATILLVTPTVNGQQQMAGDTEILSELLKGYNARALPPRNIDGVREPVKVTVNCLFRTISKIDDFNMVCFVTFRR